MTKSWTARAAWLLLVTIVVGFLVVQATPDGGRAMGIWPVGLATGCLFAAGRRRLPVLLAAILVIATTTIWLGGRPVEVAVGFALAITLESWLVWRLLTRGESAAPELRTGKDLSRLLGAITLGALMASGMSAATSAVTGWGSPSVVALAVGSAHVASQLMLLPFFMQLHDYPSLAPPIERAAQWLSILIVTPLVFFPDDFPSLVFLVIPLLGWGALRITAREALAQLVAVVASAIVMTAVGLGPFAGVSKTFGLPADSRGILLALFAIDCALIVVPLVVRAGEQIETARKFADERDKVQSMINSATGVAMVGTDEAGRITSFNPGAQQLLGYSADEVLGRPVMMLHSGAAMADKARELGVRNDFVEMAIAMATTPEMAGSDMRFVRKDGEERNHSMTLSQLLDTGGQITGYLSTSEDITERVLGEEAMSQALDAERRAVEHLRQVDAVKDSFVSSVSHELRTPITSILGYLEMLDEGAFGALNDEQGDAVRRVSANSNRLIGLIDDLLTLSRVQEGGFGIVDRAFDLREPVRTGYEVVSTAWASRDLAVSLQVPAEPIPFLGDKELVERVLMNLLANAVKFTPDGGSVRVRLGVESDEAVLSVKDTGIGIPISEQVHLFTRFFRSTLAQKGAIPGSGLGLSIARTIVEKHGGSIEAESEPGKGTTFRVRLPIVT